MVLELVAEGLGNKETAHNERVPDIDLLVIIVTTSEQVAMRASAPHRSMWTGRCVVRWASSPRSPARQAGVQASGDVTARPRGPTVRPRGRHDLAALGATTGH